MLESLRLRSLLVMGVSAAAVLAVAAPAAPAFAADDEGTTVADVIVTAQKKEEALQDVPIAVSAFSQESLEKQKIGDYALYDTKTAAKPCRIKGCGDLALSGAGIGA